jgi:hypothetical protein
MGDSVEVRWAKKERPAVPDFLKAFRGPIAGVGFAIVGQV